MAQLAHGAEIFMGDGAPTEVFTKIPGLGDTDLNPPEEEEVDVTNHDSLAREHIPGLATDGEVSTAFFYDAGEPMHVALKNKKGQPATNFQVRYPDVEGSVAAFAATVRWTHGLPVGGAAVMNVTFRISGELTLTP